MKTRIVCALLLAVLILPARAAYVSDQDSSAALDLYMRAQRSYLDLKKDEDRIRDKQAWQRIINSYQVIIDSYPNDRLVDDITFLQGDIYRKMYEIFGERPFLDLAVANYRTVLRDYPDSFLHQAALYAVGEIEEMYLQLPYKAIETYEELLRKYPNGYRTPAAKNRISALNVELGISKPESLSAANNQQPEPQMRPAADTTPARSENLSSEAEEEGEPAAADTPGNLTVVNPKVLHGKASGPALLTDIRSSFGSKSGRVTIEVSSEIQFKYEQLPAPNRRIFFDLHNVDLSRSKLAAREIAINNRYLKQIRIAQFNRGIARVVLDFNDWTKYNVFTLPGPGDHFRIVFDLYNPGKGPSFVSAANKIPGGTNPAPGEPGYSADGAKSNSNGKYSLSRQLGAKITRIVIDPGHGGKDPGARGHGNMTEKELNLDVARRLRGIFKQHMPSMEIVLTRENDSFIELDQRPAISKAKEGDLFISIHSNSTRAGRASGIETYYLNFASDKEAEQLAAKENALSRLNQAKLRDLITKITANNKKQESKELALFIQNNLYQQTRKVNGAAKNRGVRSAPFVVLIGTNVPSVLVEIGFINHKVEGKLLTTAGYRDRIANGLFYGIKAYIDSLQ